MNPFQHLSSKQKKLYTSIFLLSLLAVIVTILLIDAHYKVSASGSFCNIDDYWNCDRVNKSMFAEIYGFPVAILGFLYYGFISVLGYGLIKQWDFQKILSPFKLEWLNLSAVIGTSLVTAGLLAYEFTLLGDLFWWAILKNLLFIGIFVWTYNYTVKNPEPSTQILGFFLITALFGVNFSLYLTDIELFVLKGICVYCFTQQIIIAIISVLLIFALKQNKNELSQSTKTQSS